MKMTYAVAIDTMVAIANGDAIEDAVKDEAVARMGDLKEQLAKRNGSGSNKPTKHQTEVAGRVEHVAELLANEPDGLTCTEIATNLHYTVHEASAYAKKLIDGGRAERRKDGRVTRIVLVD